MPDVFDEVWDGTDSPSAPALSGDIFDEVWGEGGASTPATSTSSGLSNWFSLPDTSKPFNPNAAVDRLTQEQKLGGLKGVAKSALDVFTAPADLLYRGGVGIENAFGANIDPAGGYPSERVDQFLNYISGGKGDAASEAATHLAGNLATVLVAPSQAKNISKNIPVISKLAEESAIAKLFAKAIGYGTEGAGYAALADPKSENLLATTGQGAAINAAVPAVFSALTKGAQNVLPGLGAKAKAQLIAEELRKVSPGALTEAVTPAERAITAAKALEATGTEAHSAASKLFKELPEETVILDDAISKIKTYAEEVGGPITPGSRTQALISSLERLKPKDKTITTEASKVLDQFGNPITPATSTLIPGESAKLATQDIQNTLRDVGTVGQGAMGVDKAIVANAKEQILTAAEQQLSPETFRALSSARNAWKEMKTTYESGGVSKVRDILTEPNAGMNNFKNALLKDPKSARQLVEVMSPEEIANAQHLMLSDLLSKPAASWNSKITNRIDSWNAVFGDEGTSRLLDMVGHDGTIGKKLLQDNTGLKTLFAKLALNLGGGAAAGYALGGTTGAVLGGIIGAGNAGAPGLQKARIQNLLMRAAAGDDKVLAILNKPAKEYNPQIGKLAAVLSGEVDTLKAEEPQNETFRDVFTRPEMPEKSDYQSQAEKLRNRVIKQESGGNPNAVSDKGAIGLMQILESTGKDIAKDLGRRDYDLKDPDTNKEFGVHYLAKLLEQFDGDAELALTAYHSGPGRVEKLLKLTGGDSLEDIIDLLGPVGQKYAKSILA